MPVKDIVIVAFALLAGGSAMAQGESAQTAVVRPSQMT